MVATRRASSAAARGAEAAAQKNEIKVKVYCAGRGEREIACWYKFFKNINYSGIFIG
jgi:hypothetical protein